MAFTEALRLLVDADTQGAVKGLERVGATAERELSRSEQRLDKWGNRLTSLGTGMIAFGGAALVGLGALAKQSEEANLAQVKLQNTIEKMPKLAGATASEFNDLANSIQDVTAADADAIVEAEALLGTFNLTADEIKGITPLVVDYARKFGIDMADAAVQVGKALDGQVGALKRNGVSIDETLFKTDRYRAVQEALSNQVGGFAEAEGKTFAGSLERMKNQLGDLAEGVGGGAVDAFTTMFGAVDKVAGALEGISPGAQNAIGKIATFGAVGLVAAGGISALIGQAIKARENFTTAAGAVSSLTGKLGGLKTAAGLAAGVAGLAALAIAAKEFTDNTDDLQVDIEGLTDALFATSDAARQGVTDFVSLMDSMGRLDSVFQDVLEQSPEAAKQFILVAEAAGVSKKEIDAMRAALEGKQAADSNAASAQSDYTEEVEAGAEATDGATESTQNYTSAIKAQADALAAQFDPLFGMVSALRASEEAQRDVAEAQNNLNEALASGDPGKIAEAQRDYDAALSKSSDSLFDVQQAQLTLNEAIQNGDVSIGDAQKAMFNWAIQAGYTAEQAYQMAGQLGGAAAAAKDLGQQDPVVGVSITGVGPVTGDLNALKSKLDAIPREVNIITRLTQIVQGSTNIPMRAAGGPVQAGRPYIVGEHRAELFVPSQSGRIVPSVPSGGGGGGGELSMTVSGDGGLYSVIAYGIRTGQLQIVDAEGRRVRVSA